VEPFEDGVAERYVHVEKDEVERKLVWQVKSLLSVLRPDNGVIPPVTRQSTVRSCSGDRKKPIWVVDRLVREVIGKQKGKGLDKTLAG
jgi:hypothetical protein